MFFSLGSLKLSHTVVVVKLSLKLHLVTARLSLQCTVFVFLSYGVMLHILSSILLTVSTTFQTHKKVTVCTRISEIREEIRRVLSE